MLAPTNSPGPTENNLAELPSALVQTSMGYIGCGQRKEGQRLLMLLRNWRSAFVVLRAR